MKVLAVFSSLPGGEVCSDTASFVGYTKYFCQYSGAHLLYGQMFLVVMSCLRTGFLWWQERNLMIFGCFQVMERKYLLSECFSFGDESKWGFLAMVIWPWKEQSYFLGRALGVLRHRWHLVGKGRRENWTCSSEVSCCNFIPCIGPGHFCCRTAVGRRVAKGTPHAWRCPWPLTRVSGGLRSRVCGPSVVISPVSSESPSPWELWLFPWLCRGPGAGLGCWALRAPGWFLGRAKWPRGPSQAVPKESQSTGFGCLPPVDWNALCSHPTAPFDHLLRNGWAWGNCKTSI